MPFELLNQWLDEEKEAGAPNPKQAVLSTATSQAIPHSRVVAIREISTDHLLFFTQKGTRKVTELENNPRASLVFWFELKQRQVILEGFAERLSKIENENYWHSYPQAAQIRFAAYAPTSTQPIASKKTIESKKLQLKKEYGKKLLPFNPFYCGFRLKPTKFVFYTFRSDELSDVIEYTLRNNQWHSQILSP